MASDPEQLEHPDTAQNTDYATPPVRRTRARTTTEDDLQAMTREYQGGWRTGFAEALALAASHGPINVTRTLYAVAKQRGPNILAEFERQLRSRQIDPETLK